MRILGIDPGLRKTGWGIIDVKGVKVSHIAHGVCQGIGETLSERLGALYNSLDSVVKMYKPDVTAIEKTFVNKDAAGALKLGQARGVVMVVPALYDIPVVEYAPNTIKKTVVGAGHADKTQVGYMIKMLLPTATLTSEDATDALAIAICHSRHLTPLQLREYQ
jgi:crossover junction endodeoxyribonuclease RuvC